MVLPVGKFKPKKIPCCSVFYTCLITVFIGVILKLLVSLDMNPSPHGHTHTILWKQFWDSLNFKIHISGENLIFEFWDEWITFSYAYFIQNKRTQRCINYTFLSVSQILIQHHDRCVINQTMVTTEASKINIF